jgi:CheY-like chemotaxis protein
LLMNLCLNARDAIVGAGHLQIETAGIDIDDAAIFENADARSGSFVRLSVEDTGCGMSDEIRSRIFEPFFTTKAVGKGTGLGLAMVFAIVKQLRGWIECRSDLKWGTRFDIFLPRTLAALKPLVALSETPLSDGRGKETILVADDEDMVRRLAAFVLQQQGYTVLEAEDGEEAVDLFRRHGDRIDLVVLDLTMPNLSGREAFRRLLQIDPQVRVLFASGYSAEEITERDLICGFVKKPYRPKELVQIVQEALRQHLWNRVAVRQEPDLHHSCT